MCDWWSLHHSSWHCLCSGFLPAIGLLPQTSTKLLGETVCWCFADACHFPAALFSPVSHTTWVARRTRLNNVVPWGKQTYLGSCNCLRITGTSAIVLQAHTEQDFETHSWEIMMYVTHFRVQTMFKMCASLDTAGWFSFYCLLMVFHHTDTCRDVLTLVRHLPVI